jgi:hypothetical protein
MPAEINVSRRWAGIEERGLAGMGIRLGKCENGKMGKFENGEI